MYRDDRDALAGEVEDLRQELDQARGQNQAMRQALLTRRQAARITKAVYHPGGSMSLSEGERIAFSEHRLEGGSVWLIAILHILTLGVSSMVYFSLKHEKLPRVAEDDPSGGRALGFMFIPYFNWYWMFVNALRLTDRLNFQLELRGEQPMVNRNLVVATCIAGVIPYIGWFVVGPIMWLITAVYYQQAINRLAALGPGIRGQRALPPGGWGGGDGFVPGWQQQPGLPAPQPAWGAPQAHPGQMPQGYPAQGGPAQGYPAQGGPAQGYPARGGPAQAPQGQVPAGPPGWGQVGTPGAPGGDQSG